MLEKKTKQSKRRELETATPNFGQLFSGQPKKLAEIGYFFFYSLPKKQKIPPSKVVQFYKTFIFALEVLRIKRRIYP
jgi:hypothetical protein